VFLKSDTYQLLLGFVFGLTDAVQDVSISTQAKEPSSPIVKTILEVLDEADRVIETCPPIDLGGSRFGNPAFRQYLDALKERSAGWHKKLGLTDEDEVEEVQTYFLECFGNRTRIDYGSGHELNFIMWLSVSRSIHENPS
jgi:serine/threonine-protein phosphatase 2A activator